MVCFFECVCVGDLDLSRGDVLELDCFCVSGGGVVKSVVVVLEVLGMDVAGMSFVGELNEVFKELSDFECVCERLICDLNELLYFCVWCRLVCEFECEVLVKLSFFVAVT